MKDIAKLIKKALKDQHEVGVATVAQGTDIEVPVFTAPSKGRITRLGFVPKAAITGAAGNYFTLGFKNKGSDGAGTNVIKEKAYTNGVDVAAFDEEDLGAPAVTYRDLSKGDVVSFHKTETGTGMAMPDLIAFVEFQPDFVLGD